ncbi:MAG: adenosylhomocysteinase [Firmicutes bacterium]|nr:adenosylhomocysteinase [Bacillota bacterium]
MSHIRHPELAGEGLKKIDWASRHMPVLQALEKSEMGRQPFTGLKIAICIHLEAKTAYLARVLNRCGATVAATGSNPLSTQDDIAAGLDAIGVKVYAWHGATEEDYFQHLRAALNPAPDLVIDDGGDLINLLHTEKREILPKIRGGAEETTTGLNRLRAMAEKRVLAFPVIAVNDARCKYLFDNRYGTGQSVWDGIMRTTNLLISGKSVVVAGFGWCGRGVALRARGLGAKVIITEVEPVRALEAALEGYTVMTMAEAAAVGDIFVTTTGCCRVINERHFPLMKDGALLANAGHFDVEIDKGALGRVAAYEGKPRANIDQFGLPDGRKIYLLAEGRLVNLAAGDGHPAEIMDLSFALQFLSLKYLLENRDLPREVIKLPSEIDQQVARLKLEALGINIDKLTPEQHTYLHSWEG